MASLADYNFSLEYQKGKDNTVADFLSCMENRLPEEEVEEALCRVEILAPGVKAMLDNADTPITERVEGGMMCSLLGPAWPRLYQLVQSNIPLSKW